MLAAVTAATVLAACGSNGSEEEPDTLGGSLDAVCSEFTPTLDAFGTRGLTNPGLVAEFTDTAETRLALADAFAEIEADPADQADLDKYVSITREIAEGDKAIARAAKSGDSESVNAAFEDQNSSYAERDKLIRKLGLEVCGQPAAGEVEQTGTSPDESLIYAAPDNTVEEAVAAYLKAAESGDCAAINEQRHEDAGEADDTTCKAIAGSLKGAKSIGTESYGPAGQAEIVGQDGTHYPTAFVEDLDGTMRYVSDAIHDSGGLRPAPDGNDAGESIVALTDAIREGDADAFNALLPDEESAFRVDEDDFEAFGSGEYADSFISDLRNDDGSMMLGLNSTYGFYLLPGSIFDWVINLIHTPGSGAEYRFAGFYPIPKPE